MNTNRERVIHFHWPHKSQLRDGSAELSPAGPASSTSCSLRCSHGPHLAAQRSTPTTATSSRAPSRRTSNSHQGDRRGALLRPSSDLADKLARSATSGTASCASYAARRESSLGWDTSRSSMGHIRCVGRVRAGARAPAQEKRRHARAVCPAGEAWSKGRLRQGAACAAPCVHIRAASALGYDASVRVCERELFQL